MNRKKTTEGASDAPPTEPNLEVENHIIHTWDLTKKFNDQTAVRDVNFYVPRGKIFGFIGPSGSGKTTTIRMLTGYYKPTSGDARVFGERPTEFSLSTRERIGYMPQLFALYPNLSVWENLNFAASIYGMSYFRKKRLREILDFVELMPHRDKLARNISGGMQRRLSLAATLVNNPDLVFLDEPTAGVDPVLRNRFWEKFRDLKDEGRTLFVTTQYVSEAAYCDLVAVMGEGYLIVVDTPDKLRQRAFGGDMMTLRLTRGLDWVQEESLRNLPYVYKVIHARDGSLRLVVDEAATAMPALVNWSREENLEVESIEEFFPPFDDVFVELVERERENA